MKQQKKERKIQEQAKKYRVLQTFGVMGNMLSFRKRLEDATTSTASGQ